MSGRSAIWKTILPLFLVAAVASAQTNLGSCPSFVRQAYSFALEVCAVIVEGQACLGNGSVTVTSAAGDAIQLTNAGAQFDLVNFERLRTQSMTADPHNWTTLVARFTARDLDGAPATLFALVIGDVVLWREQSDAPPIDAAADFFPATIEAPAGVIVRQEASAGSSNIWQLLDGARVQAIGRSGNGEWIRIMIPSPYGGAGWVYNRFVAVDGGSQALPYHTNASPVPGPASSADAETAAPPRLRMESLPVRDDCTEATDSGLLLQSPSLDRPLELELNGVRLQLAGAAFVTAQVGGNMSVFSLEGTTSLIVNDQRTDLPASTSVQVALDATLSPIATPAAGQPFSESFSADLAFLPLQLLPLDLAAPDAMDPREATPICPFGVAQTYSNLGLFCDSLATGFACLGNGGSGMVGVIPSVATSNVEFARPGDISDFNQIEGLTLSARDDAQGTWPAAQLQLEADTGGGSIAVATILLLGDVELTNRSAALMHEPADQTGESSASQTRIEATVQAAGSISIRDQPRVDTESVTMVGDQQLVTALQRSLDQQWILVETGEGIRGWIVAQYLRLPEFHDALPIFDPDQPPPPETSIAQAAQDENVGGNRLVLDFNSRDVFPGCGDVPPGGLLIQAPDDIDGVLRMTINGADLELNGTAYLTATDESMTLNSLERAASFAEPGASIILFEGEQMTVPLTMGQMAEDAVGVSRMYSSEESARFASLPIEVLPRSIDVYIATSEIPSTVVADEVVEEGSSETEEPIVDETSSTVDEISAAVQTDDGTTECIISAGGLARNLRQGPGTDFQIVDVLQVGQSVAGRSQKRGTFGLYWYHTDRGWIRFDAGEPTASCVRLPFYIAAAGEFDEDEDDAPPLHLEFFGDVCAAGGAVRSATIERSGRTYHEFAGVWTGQPGVSATFSADIGYFHESFGNVLAFVNEDGSFWRGSQSNTSFTINFADTRRFRVRVSGLLGDHVTLRVSC